MSFSEKDRLRKKKKKVRTEHISLDSKVNNEFSGKSTFSRF
jgi:hypothetical protein